MKNEEEGTTSREAAQQSTTTVVGEHPEPRSIVVNGRSHVHAGDRISTHDLVRFAFPGADRLERSALTVAYDGGPLQAHSGLLAVNASTPITEGQSFSVSLTDKS